jgi:Kelch motif
MAPTLRRDVYCEVADAEAPMQRLNHILPRLIVLLPWLLLGSGCAISSLPGTPSQAITTQGTPPGTTKSPTGCTSACTPYISLSTFAIGLKPGVSYTFSATVSNAGDPSVAWSIQEGPTGGMITDTGVYTASAVEGVYHVIATSKASLSLTATATVAVTATELTATGQVSTSRYLHSASLLPSGQVFIAGGSNDDYDFADPAELYDPATGQFQDAGEVSRAGHSATVLANGDVLLAGGGEVWTTADLRKAGSGLIQPTGSMNTPRYNHSATLLQDGRVLIAGGATDFTINNRTQTAELYDPATGKFASTGDMATPRSGQSAVMLPNGRVLIVGGAAGAELYDPATTTFLPAPGVSANRCKASATLLADGRVLIAGGLDCSNNLLDTAEIYAPSTGETIPAGKLVAAQAPDAAVLLRDGRVLLVGGTPSVVTQIYDPVTGSFTLGPHPLSPKPTPTATLLPDGSVLIVGGEDAEIYKGVP